MFSRIIITLALTLSLATPAFAEFTGIYAGGKFIDSYQTQWGGGRLDGTTSQNTIGLGFFVGYDFYANSDTPVRAELEYAFRSEFKNEGNYRVGTSVVNNKMDSNMHTLLANAYYDFYNESIFTPYIGVGIGMAFIDGHNELNVGGVHYSEEVDDTVFAWQAGAGVGVAITDRVTADLGYRYLGTSTVNSEIAGGDVKTDLSSHEFSVGIRFGF